MSKTLFKDQLRRWREAKSLTQEEAAKKLSMPLRTYQGWESGHEPRGFARSAIEKIISSR